MSAIVIPIRDAVCTALRDANLTPALKVTPGYDLVYTLQEIGDGQISVMPQTKSPTLQTRSGLQKREVKIDVAVQYKYAEPTSDELDKFVALAEAIPDVFIPKGVEFTIGVTKYSAACLEASFPHGMFMQEHVEKLGMFTSVITLTFVINN